MYTAKILTTHFHYLNPVTGEEALNLNQTEKNIGVVYGRLLYVETMKCHATISAKKVEDLNGLAWQKGIELGLGYDFQVYYVKKSKKK